MGVEPKIGVVLPFYPPNHPMFNRVVHYFHHPFWGTPFLETPRCAFEINFAMQYSNNVGLFVLVQLCVALDFLGMEDLIRALSEGNGPVPKRLNSLKRVIITRMVQEAKSRVIQKVFNEGWSGGISPGWIALMTEAPRAWCNGIGRYTLLRWALNQDDDVWLSMRGTRHQQKCGSCGLPGDTFPQGYYHPPSCEACIRATGTNVWSMAPWSLQLCLASTAANSQDLLKAWVQEWDIMPAHDVVCRACGCGDNTIGHWTRWCVVPLIVAIAILKPGHVNLTICQLACQSPRHAVICTLILASFRRLLRQEGAFLHQQSAEAKSVQWWVSHVIQNMFILV